MADSRLAHMAALQPPPDMSTGRKESGTPREQYRMHKVNATKRGISFRLTFEEWFAWWQATGHYHERGRGRGQYVMARKGDQGAYELGNIECVQAQENSVLPHAGKARSPETRARISAAATGHAVTQGTRKKLSEATRRVWASRRKA